MHAAVGMDTRSSSGWRRRVAIPRALRTSEVPWVPSTDHPTTRRENASRMTQQ